MFVMVKQIRKTKGIKTVSIELHVALPLQVIHLSINQVLNYRRKGNMHKNASGRVG